MALLLRTGIPFEALYGIKPTLAHMHIYGCRAYPLKHNIPKLQKLEPRAHIGYLVGYDSRNIYRIWVPSKNQVIRTRDVSFDENTFYKLDDVDGALLVQEQELHDNIQILQEIPEDILAHNQDLEELEIPAVTHTNPTPPTTTKQSDNAATTERQPYPTPAFSDVGNTQSSTSAPPSVGAPAVNNREHVGERIGERPWEYRPVGTQRRDPSKFPQMLMKISFSQTGLGTVDKPMLQSSTISTNIPVTMPPLQQISYQKITSTAIVSLRSRRTGNKC